MSDAYADLGLRGPLEDMTVIKAVWSKLKTINHPDKGGDPQVFDRVMKAWEVLSDPQAKAALDAQLRAAEQAPPAPGASSGASAGASAAGGADTTAPGPRRRTATAQAPVVEENPWLAHAQSVTTPQRAVPWFTPAVAQVVFAAIFLLAVSTVQRPTAMALELFGDPSLSILRAWGLTAVAWGLILLVIPSVLPVALILAGISGMTVVALFGETYPVAHSLAVGFTLSALIAVRNARTNWSAIRALHLRGSSFGAVLGAPTSLGEERLAGLASEIAQNTAGAWSGTYFKIGSTVTQLIFVGARAGVLISADHVPLPSRVLGGTDWQRVAGALEATDIARARKALDAHGFAPYLYVVTGPGTGGSATVALDKHTTVTMLSPGMASAVIGSALVLEQHEVSRRTVRIAKAVNALHSS